MRQPIHRCATVLLIIVVLWFGGRSWQQSTQQLDREGWADQTQSGSTSPAVAAPADTWRAQVHQQALAGFKATAAYGSSLLHTHLSTARTLLGIEQQPVRPSTPQQQQQQQQQRPNADSRTLPIDSADLPPVLNPSVLNRTRPRPVPAPAATSAAAGEAASVQGPYTGPTVKPVSEVRAGDSCVCWTPDWCTCGWQSCPYKPPDEVAALPSESAELLFGQDVLPQLVLSGDVSEERVAPLLSEAMLRRFNKRISTQLINPLYQFTSEHYLLEGAREVVAAGGDSFKFNLANLDARGNAISNVRTPLDMVRSPSLPYAELFEQPLSMFFFWVFPNYSKPYDETLELATYLLQKYQGTGKQFFIGMWEGDHALRKPGNLGHGVPPDLSRLETLQYVIQEKQRALDDAKKTLGGACRDVYVWNHIEANFVVDSIWQRNKASIINYLVPTIDAPPVDYISYSAYEVLFSGDWRLTNLTAAFDYMAQRLPDKPGVPGPRVFLGEWAYPLYDAQGRRGWDMEESREKGLYAAAVAIAWGSQFNQYWQLYSNHRLANGTGDRGFWLVLPNRQEAPIWASMKDYFAASDIFLQRFWSCYGGWPSDYTYRVWAVKTLMKLVNNDTKPEPTVRQLGSTAYARQARVVADNTFGSLGPTINFRVSGEAPAAAAARAGSYVAVTPSDTWTQQPQNPSSGRRRRRSSSSSSSSSSSVQSTPPLVPNFLVAGGGDRGDCPIPRPMIPPGRPLPKPSPAPAANSFAGGNRTAAAPGTTGNSTAAAGSAGGNGTRSANATAAGAAAGAARPANVSGMLQPTLLAGFSGNGSAASRVQAEAGVAVRSAGGKGGRCEAWPQANSTLVLNKQDCPFTYPRITVEDVSAGKAKPYTFGGIDRIGCANCQQKGLWPNFCLWRRTEVPVWDAISCNQRESTGRSSVQRNLDLAVNLTRYWPGNTGIRVPPEAQQRAPPGPAEITPCEVYRLIRGRALWIIGDSQMKGLYTALKCFMLEFWDLQQYAPTWNSSTLDYFNKLPRNAEARCIHLPEATRICQLKVLWADTFAEQPSQNETRWSVPVWPVLQQLAAPEDIFVLNFGLWYDPKNPTRYYNNLQSVGRVYQAARSVFPNWFFVETVKLHWPDPPGDQDGPRTVQESGGGSMEMCKPTDNVVFDPRTSELRMASPKDAAAAAAAGMAAEGQQLQGVVPTFYTDAASSSSSSASDGGSSSSGRRHRRRLFGFGATGSPSSSSDQTGLSLPHWVQWARQLLLVPLRRTLLEQQQQQAAEAQPAATAAAAASASSSGGSSRTPAGGPLEDSPVFSGLQPTAAAQSPQGQQQPQQQQQQGLAPSSLPPPRAGNGSSSSSSSSSPVTAAVLESGAGASLFPRLQPMFAANSSSGRAAGAPNGSTPANASSGSTPPAKPSAAAAPTPTAGAAPSKPSPLPLPSPAAAAATAAAAAAAPAAAASKPPVLAPGFGSVTLPPELAPEAVLSGLWRNQIARTVLRDRFGMAWVPIYNATVPAYWGHRNSPDAPDCIHYCNPGAPQNWMAKLMLAIAVNTQPLQGEVPDRRCLWGTDVVREEGEAPGP